MSDNSSIEWTDATWQPITGCSVVSPGCTNCYAMKLAGTRLRNHVSRVGLTTLTKAGPVWNGAVRLNEQWLTQPLARKSPRRIFVCAHGDLFHESVPDEWIDGVFAVMALAPQHTFQVLTKRAARMRAYLSDGDLQPRLGATATHILSPSKAIVRARELRHSICPLPLPNVWLGVSAERQQEADQRVPDLLATPAAVRFVSAEPLLGPIDFTALNVSADIRVDALQRYIARRLAGGHWENIPSDAPGLDWIIVGGESGSNARPMHPNWARSLRDQCAGAGVPFFFKQWGEWAPNIGAVDGWTLDDDPEISRFDHREWDGGRWSEPFRPMWCDFSDGNYDEHQCVARIGKKHSGRTLDAVIHDGMPEVRR